MKWFYRIAIALIVVAAFFLILHALNKKQNVLPEIVTDSTKIYQDATIKAKIDYERADSAYRNSIITDRDRAEYIRAIRQRDSIRASESRAR